MAKFTGVVFLCSGFLFKQTHLPQTLKERGLFNANVFKRFVLWLECYRAELLELNLGTVKPSPSPGDLPRLAEDLTIRSLLAAPLYQTSLQEQDADSALRILAAALGVE